MIATGWQPVMSGLSTKGGYSDIRTQRNPSRNPRRAGEQNDDWLGVVQLTWFAQVYVGCRMRFAGARLL